MTNDLLKFCLVGNSKSDIELVINFFGADLPLFKGLKWSYRDNQHFTIAESSPSLVASTEASSTLEYVATRQVSFPKVLCVAYTADPDAGLAQLTGVVQWELPRYSEEVLARLLTGE